MNFVTIVTFYDRQGNEIATYDPWMSFLIHFYPSENYENWLHHQETVEYKIEENEELIGVYGVDTPKNFLTSLGFIVKVKQSD